MTYRTNWALTRNPGAPAYSGSFPSRCPPGVESGAPYPQSAKGPYRMGRGRMTDIDPNSDVELSTADGQAVGRIPLAGGGRGEWLRGYQRLARPRGGPVPGKAEADPA